MTNQQQAVRLTDRDKVAKENKLQQQSKQHAQLPEAKRHFDARAYLLQHKQACYASFNHFIRTPFAMAMTILVIGIAIALPCFLYVIINNAEILSQGWDNTPQVSLYLKQDIDAKHSQAIIKQIQRMPEVTSVKYVSPEQGLRMFEKESGLTDAINQLPTNPLPGVIEVEPSSSLQGLQAINTLGDKLKNVPGVAQAEMDARWIKRLFGILELAENGVIALAFLLGLGVLLIVGNTIRLATQSYHEEIETIKLVGGTDAFIRRPFLYTGVFYGLFAGLVAWILVEVICIILHGTVKNLAMLYDSQFSLQGLGFGAGLLLLLMAAGLGLLGSWFVVNRHLLDVEPT